MAGFFDDNPAHSLESIDQTENHITDSIRVIHRTRVACDLCHSSKLKCDENRPCGRCIAKGVPNQCRDRVAPIAGAKRKRRRAEHVSRPCLSCAMSKVACDPQRPCRRCIRLNREDMCLDRGPQLVSTNSTSIRLVQDWLRMPPLGVEDRVPDEVGYVWSDGWKIFSPFVIEEFMRNPIKLRMFVKAAASYIPPSNIKLLVNELCTFSKNPTYRKMGFDQDVSSGLHNAVEIAATSTRDLIDLVEILGVPGISIHDIPISRVSVNTFGPRPVLQLSLNGPAQLAFGYTPDDFYRFIGDDSTQTKRFKLSMLVPIIMRLVDRSSWKHVMQVLVNVWFKGECAAEIPLVIARADGSRLRSRSMWRFRLDQNGVWRDLLIFFIPQQ